MSKINLVLPNLIYKTQYLNMVEEYKLDIKKTGFDIFIPISNNNTFEDDIEKLHLTSQGINLPQGWVPESVFWLLNKDSNIIGVISIRHNLTPNLKFRGGHIAYYIVPSQRKKGYATKMLKLALNECKKLNITKALITCSKSNIASAKTIINNGGIIHSEDTLNGDVFQRYWITI
ncbi:GNAT family N-acetyltransferase [Clostridium sp.]|uniref:GNAT family N-acetyltransferase n=1 Tax=Clostridium sp. TaxID=1506 RepID=UPI003F305C1E